MSQTKEYYLKVTVTSDLLPENQGNVSNNISTGIFSAFIKWKNTAINVVDVAPIDPGELECLKVLLEIEQSDVANLCNKVAAAKKEIAELKTKLKAKRKTK